MLENNNKNSITEKAIEQLSSNSPHKHISALDLINIGYTFDIKSTSEGHVLQSVKHCHSPMTIELFREQLWHLGIDNSSSIYVEVVLHRPIQTKSPTVGFRFGGLERSDKEWINGNFSSYEAKMCSSGMKDMYEEVSRMSEGATSKIAERFYYNNNKKRHSLKRDND